MLYYAKITLKSNPEDIRKSFYDAGADDSQIYMDDSNAQKQPGSVYDLLKEKLRITHEPLTIDTVLSLGKNAREIFKELNWFTDNHVKLIILDVPCSMQDSAVPLEILRELYGSLADKEISNLKRNQRIGIEQAKAENRPLGRQKIPYPKNWVEQYERWEAKEISAAEFQESVGLKKGTFYNLIKQYRMQQAQ